MLIAREVVPAASSVVRLAPDDIAPNPEQPRKKFPMDELEMLKSSIARDGFLQPVVVRRLEDGSYQLVVGERRLRAARELGLEEIPAVVSEVEDERLLELALIENVQREDLNPIELASGYRRLMEAKGWTQEVLAENLGVSRSGVSNTLRLLDLDTDIQEAIARGHISMGHAKVLLSVADRKEQRVLFERIAEEKLTVRDLELERDGGAAAEDGDAKDSRRKKRRRRAEGSLAPHLVSLQEQFQEKLGTRVSIRERGGKGKLVIEFYSSEDFERIRGIILGG